MGSSQIRARTRVPCIGRRILNHCATREAPPSSHIELFSSLQPLGSHLCVFPVRAFYPWRLVIISFPLSSNGPTAQDTLQTAQCEIFHHPVAWGWDAASEQISQFGNAWFTTTTEHPEGFWMLTLPLGSPPSFLPGHEITDVSRHNLPITQWKILSTAPGDSELHGQKLGEDKKRR